ncbi:MAG: glycine/betaine/sarcosine/D-proline family reductase selenoprotein B [Chloroflexi bacterium]|nr:glycine/betaine/sarcosine/D-proline family reductase selenoprotein B [Chloroflexota bacterium]
MSRVRLIHFLNQFFAGEGGEEKADLALTSKKGPVGPGRRLQGILGESAEIVATVYCGDNYFVSHSQEVIESIAKIARDQDVGMLVAGPSFMAGRYGFACVEVCHALGASLGLPAVTGMHPENAAVDAYRQYQDLTVYAVTTTEDAAGMEAALSGMAKLVSKLATGSPVGSASEEGYIPRGYRPTEYKSKTGAERAIDMLLSRAAGRAFESEIPIENLEPIPVTPRMESLKGTLLALVTSSGVVPLGNPDGFKLLRNTQWKKYPIEGLVSMQDVQWDVVHAGYNTQFAKENPNYVVPLDIYRQLEKDGEFARLYPYFYMTSGAASQISDMQAIGKAMVQDMKGQGVGAVVVVST